MSTLSRVQAREEALSIPLDRIDVSNPKRFQDDTVWPFFERLRREEPVHYCSDSMFGPYWSVTKYRDIMAVDTNHNVFSSEAGGIVIFDRKVGERYPNFIAMDPPKHDEQRKTVSPIVAPANLANLEGLIRSRVCAILDSLPRGETFNWVEQVSIELTTQMLATLFDFPFEERRLLTYWSDVATTFPQPGQPIDTWEKRDAILAECLAYFTGLWNERINKAPGYDLISMLAHSPSTRNMGPREFLGNLILLIVGGNDTTRNSITGGLWFMSQNRDQLQKLRGCPALIPGAVSEIIRYQTPLAHMRRTALRDATVGGKQIKAGDKVIMWYISGNRDSEVIESPDSFIIDRKNPRQHLSFGFGIHRCVGNRLAELQLRILWEEMLERRLDLEVVGDPERVPSNFVHGYSALPVRIAA
ncbi:cytochrome P450 [Bradyrhizobium sp. Tv2a-2]|uniref:cytochrome P450 n=1 Tax=Bradyrhizobium sp. Tv2a-2 TaxID=113395 RepID=UPI0004102B33|nr:cytochrome P450 [Bradyrhizobium sp. Tv2a-2]